MDGREVLSFLQRHDALSPVGSAPRGSSGAAHEVSGLFAHAWAGRHVAPTNANEPRDPRQEPHPPTPSPRAWRGGVSETSRNGETAAQEVGGSCARGWSKVDVRSANARIFISRYALAASVQGLRAPLCREMDCLKTCVRRANGDFGGSRWAHFSSGATTFAAEGTGRAMERPSRRASISWESTSLEV